jgi:hypothetical protein
MKKRKALLFMAVMAAALLVLSACGGGGSVKDSVDFNEPQAATEAVENLEAAVQNNDSAVLEKRIPEAGVSANIMGKEKTYQKSESQDLVDEIRSSTDTQIFNIVNRNTTENSTEDEETMVISGELIESASPFSDSQSSDADALAMNNIELQYKADNFTIETPDNWIEDSETISYSSIEIYSAYSNIKNEGAAVLFFDTRNASDFGLQEVTDEFIKEIKNYSTELGELGIHNFNVKRRTNTTVNNKKAVRIDSSFESEYKMYKLILEYKNINGKYYLVNMRVEGSEEAGNTLSIKDTAYLIKGDNDFVIFDYAADESAFSENNLERIINSFKIN